MAATARDNDLATSVRTQLICVCATGKTKTRCGASCGGELSGYGGCHVGPNGPAKWDLGPQRALMPQGKAQGTRKRENAG